MTLGFAESVSGVLLPLAKSWLFLSTSETVKSTICATLEYVNRAARQENWPNF